MPSEYIHYQRPGKTGKHRPGIVGSLGPELGGNKLRERVQTRLYCEFGHCEGHTSKDVDDNLGLISSVDHLFVPRPSFRFLFVDPRCDPPRTCLLKLPLFRPNTTYPPSKPATKLS